MTVAEVGSVVQRWAEVRADVREVARGGLADDKTGWSGPCPSPTSQKPIFDVTEIVMV